MTGRQLFVVLDKQNSDPAFGGIDDAEIVSVQAGVEVNSIGTLSPGDVERIDLSDFIDKVYALLAQAQPVPDGYMLVPMAAVKELRRVYDRLDL